MGAALMPKRLKKFLLSPIGGLLILSTCTFAWCAFQIIAPPPFGINTGWASSASGAECIGPDFEPMPVCICPRETTCIKDIKSLVFLAFARLSAYFDYPLYVMLFLSKAHNLRGILHRTFLREFLPLDDLHSLHVFAGKVVAIEVFWHSFWHLLRWGLAGDLRLLWQHSTGISGLISLILTPLITWPMLYYMKTIFTQIDDDAWRFIFYTGKRNLLLFERPTNPRVKVCFGRPDLEELIISLVDNTHHGREMPKKLLEGAAAAESKIYMKSPTPSFSYLLERAMVSYSVTWRWRSPGAHPHGLCRRPLTFRSESIAKRLCCHDARPVQHRRELSRRGGAWTLLQSRRHQ